MCFSIYIFANTMKMKIDKEKKLMRLPVGTTSFAVVVVVFFFFCQSLKKICCFRWIIHELFSFLFPLTSHTFTYASTAILFSLFFYGYNNNGSSTASPHCTLKWPLILLASNTTFSIKIIIETQLNDKFKFKIWIIFKKTAVERYGKGKLIELFLLKIFNIIFSSLRHCQILFYSTSKQFLQHLMLWYMAAGAKTQFNILICVLFFCTQ